MRVPKRPFVFQFKNEKRKTNFMYLNHLFSKIKIKMKNKIEYIYIYIYIYKYVFAIHNCIIIIYYIIVLDDMVFITYC